jgi:hypothetical protein
MKKADDIIQNICGFNDATTQEKHRDRNTIRNIILSLLSLVAIIFLFIEKKYELAILCTFLERIIIAVQENSTSKKKEEIPQ